jgi:hypothetical protein
MLAANGDRNVHAHEKERASNIRQLLELVTGYADPERLRQVTPSCPLLRKPFRMRA